MQTLISQRSGILALQRGEDVNRCANGKTITLEVAWRTNGSENKTFVIDGTEGGAELVPGKERLECFETDRRTAIDVDRVDPYERQAQAFLDAVENGTEPERNAIEGALTVQRVIDGIYRSADSATKIGEAPVTSADTSLETTLVGELE